MRNRTQKPLTDEQVLLFWEVVRDVARASKDCEKKQDYEGHTAMLNQLYHCGVDRDDFDEFLMVLQDASDPDTRSPK